MPTPCILTVEAFFSQPVKLHAAFNTGMPDQMLFPITGRHSDQPIVFLGRNGQYMANGPILEDGAADPGCADGAGFHSEW